MNTKSAVSHGTYKIPALRVLSEITSSLSSENNLEELLQSFLGTLIRLSGANAGAVRVLTADGQKLRLVGSVGLPPEVRENERYIKVECGVCGEAARDHSVHYSNDMHTCSERSSLNFFGEQCKRVIAVPLRYKGKMLGVYNLFMPQDNEVPEDVALLFNSISEHLGLALENARLTRENFRVTLMNERQMLANEIHDSMAQTLAYMKMRMTLLRDTIQKGDCSKSLRYTEDVNIALDSAYTSLRSLITNFRNRMDSRGLLHALQDMVDSYEERTGIVLDFNNLAPDLNLTPDNEVQVFHIVQEALTNVYKHSRAHNAQLHIELSQGYYNICVDDDGIGLSHLGQGDGQMHFGLNIMRERAQRLEGEVHIFGLDGGGTRVQLIFPAPGSNKTRQTT